MRRLALAAPFLILHKLFTNRLEQFFVDQRRNGNRDAFLGRRIVDRVGATRRLGLIALRTKSGAAFTDPCLSEGRFSFVSGIFENSPHRRSIPPCLAAWARDLLAFQTSAHLSERHSVPADPLEDLSHDLGVFEHDLVESFASAVPLRDIPVSIRAHRKARSRALGAPHGTCRDGFARGSWRVRTRRSCPAFATANLLRGCRRWFDSGRSSRHRTASTPRQAESGRRTSGPGDRGNARTSDRRHRVRRVAQSLQRGTPQRCPAVALVDESEFFRKRTAVGDNALLERSSGCRSCSLSLAAPRKPALNRHSNVMAFHDDHAPFAAEPTAGERSGTPPGSDVVRRPRWRMSIGTASSKARARICFSSRPPENRRSMAPNPHFFRPVPSMASSSLRLSKCKPACDIDLARPSLPAIHRLQATSGD